MNARSTIILSALLALALPAAGAAQRGPRGPLGPGGAGSPVERWLELKDDLNLTQDQVTRLEAIREELRSENAAHLQHIRDVREELGLPELRSRERHPRAEGERGEGERPRERMSDEDREARRAFMDRIRDDMDAIRHNTREAMEQARDVLTEEQRELARERMRAEMRERRGMRSERRERGESRRRTEGGGSGT